MDSTASMEQIITSAEQRHQNAPLSPVVYPRLGRPPSMYPPSNHQPQQQPPAGDQPEATNSNAIKTRHIAPQQDKKPSSSPGTSLVDILPVQNLPPPPAASAATPSPAPKKRVNKRSKKGDDHTPDPVAVAAAIAAAVSGKKPPRFLMQPIAPATPVPPPAPPPVVKTRRKRRAKAEATSGKDRVDSVGQSQDGTKESGQGGLGDGGDPSGEPPAKKLKTSSKRTPPKKYVLQLKYRKIRSWRLRGRVIAGSYPIKIRKIKCPRYGTATTINSRSC
ncbi:hypothetical protein HK104_003574, partial [Borealophlyctis nickersoniae]